MLTLLTIGPFVLAATGALLFVLLRSEAAHVGRPGLVAGLGVPLILIAYLNRHGPGDHCTTSELSTRCTEEWSPWPWLIAGLLGVVVAVVATRGRLSN